MVKKQRERIDEDLIRNLIGGVDAPPRLDPKPETAASLPEVSPAETPPKQETIVVAHTGKGGRGSVGKEYERLFLHPQNCLPDSSCRIKRSTLSKLNLIVRILGKDGTTVKSYISNILEVHLEQYRDEINYLLNKAKTIEL